LSPDTGPVFGKIQQRWSQKVRSVLGLCEDYQHGSDNDHLAAFHQTAGYTNGGTIGQSLVQPKGSLINTASDRLEIYASAGKGFHSADLRGVNQDKSPVLGLPYSPLLARQVGEKVGMRAEAQRNLTFTFAVYKLWQSSETILNPDVGQDGAARRVGAMDMSSTSPTRSDAGWSCMPATPATTLDLHSRLTMARAT
jgi:hypothetical protein